MVVIAILTIFKFAYGITHDVSMLAEQILNGSWDDQPQCGARYAGNELEIIVENYHLLLRKFQAAMESARILRAWDEEGLFHTVSALRPCSTPLRPAMLLTQSEASSCLW